jgi:dipeptide/tripeptide permease
MEIISTNQKYSKQTIQYVGSRALERASFYGIRGLITLYMINGLILQLIFFLKSTNYFSTHSNLTIVTSTGST